MGYNLFMNKTTITKPPKQKYFTKPKDFFVGVLGLLATVYLLNFTFGFVEFLPDNLPIVGNIDEAAATYLLYSVLAYFNIDVTSFLSRGGTERI